MFVPLLDSRLTINPEKDTDYCMWNHFAVLPYKIIGVERFCRLFTVDSWAQNAHTDLITWDCAKEFCEAKGNVYTNVFHPSHIYRLKGNSLLKTVKHIFWWLRYTFSFKLHFTYNCGSSICLGFYCQFRNTVHLLKASYTIEFTHEHFSSQ